MVKVNHSWLSSYTFAFHTTMRNNLFPTCHPSIAPGNPALTLSCHYAYLRLPTPNHVCVRCGSEWPQNLDLPSLPPSTLKRLSNYYFPTEVFNCSRILLACIYSLSAITVPGCFAWLIGQRHWNPNFGWYNMHFLFMEWNVTKCLLQMWEKSFWG